MFLYQLSMFFILLFKRTFVSSIEDYVYKLDPFQWWMKTIAVPLHLQLNFKDEIFYQTKS